MRQFPEKNDSSHGGHRVGEKINVRLQVALEYDSGMMFQYVLIGERLNARTVPPGLDCPRVVGCQE